jgi:hypothetical protein
MRFSDVWQSDWSSPSPFPMLLVGAPTTEYLRSHGLQQGRVREPEWLAIRKDVIRLNKAGLEAEYRRRNAASSATGVEVRQVLDVNSGAPSEVTFVLSGGARETSASQLVAIKMFFRDGCIAVAAAAVDATADEALRQVLAYSKALRPK